MTTPEPQRGAMIRYFELMGSDCDHHHDECPDDCPRVAWHAEQEHRALVAEVGRLREALTGNEAKLADVKCQLLEMLDLMPVPGSRWRMNIKSALRTIDAALSQEHGK